MLLFLSPFFLSSLPAPLPLTTPPFNPPLTNFYKITWRHTLVFFPASPPPITNLFPNFINIIGGRSSSSFSSSPFLTVVLKMLVGGGGEEIKENLEGGMPFWLSFSPLVSSHFSILIFLFLFLPPPPFKIKSIRTLKFEAHGKLCGTLDTVMGERGRKGASLIHLTLHPNPASVTPCLPATPLGVLARRRA